MELVKRYIYAVTQKLPLQQRSDIEKELQGLIEDMLEERTLGKEATRKEVEEVLLELGSPSDLADKYRGSKRFLISSDLFPAYITVLKIVLISIGIGMTVAFAIEAILEPTNVLEYFLKSLVGCIMGLVQGFAWVTIAFALGEYAGVKKEKLVNAHAWKPSELPPLPDSRTLIKWAEPIASILFTILFMVLFIYSLDFLGVWVFQDGEPSNVVPFLDNEVFRKYLPYIGIVMAIGVLKDSLKLITRKWSIKLIGMELLTIILYFVLALFMFSDLTVWNPDFLEQLAQSGLTPASGDAFQTVSRIWNRVTENIIYLIGIVSAIQVVYLVVKAYRLRNIK